MLDQKDLYITKPLTIKLFHVFSKDKPISLCGKVMILNPVAEACEEVKGTEQYQKGQDCKACFRKAGLRVTEMK